jgi:2'-5' RNA ligase
MAKAGSAVGETIWMMPRTDRSRPAELLHTTVLALADLAEVGREYVAAFLRAMEGFEGNAFDLRYDRIRERRSVALYNRQGLESAQAFQSALMHFLRQRNFPYFGGAPQAHMTINYKPDGLGEEAISPIGWRVTELLLVESIVGKKRHEVHGCWQLIA